MNNDNYNPIAFFKARRTSLHFDRSTNPWSTVRGATREVLVFCNVEPQLRHTGGGEQLTFGIIKGGVTGYERVFVDDDFIRNSVESGWLACAGTPGSYDELYVPCEQMRAAFDLLGVHPTTPHDNGVEDDLGGPPQ